MPKTQSNNLPSNLLLTYWTRTKYWVLYLSGINGIYGGGINCFEPLVNFKFIRVFTKKLSCNLSEK